MAVLALSTEQWSARQRGRSRASVAWLCGVAAMFVAASQPAIAQTDPLAPPAGAARATDQPMLLQADEMIYDNKNNVVVARGNVEIYYGAYTLLAEQVTYDRKAQTLEAEGNVRIKQPDGALIRADRITLTDDFRDGFIRSLQIVTQEDVRIGAAQAVRQDAETTVFDRAVFTPCKPCEDDPSKPPTWRIKAQRVIHKKSEATITYENATFDFMGYTLAWVPWFRHADPSVKRKSGFLIPTYSHSDELGSAVEVPYYFALAPNYDFTLSPMITEKQGILWKGKWRHRTLNGRYNLNLAGIDQTNPKQGFATSDDDFRGSIDTAGHFAINSYWSWGWDAKIDSDETFRRFYGLDHIHRTDRISQIYLTGLKDRNYFDMRGYVFNGLLGTDTPLADAIVHPVIDYNYIVSDPVAGGELSFNTNVVSLTRDGGSDSHRLISEFQWRRTLVDGLGQVFTPFLGARGDLYTVSSVTDSTTGRFREDDDVARGTAVAGIEYRYPFVAHTASASHVLEPIAQVIARPDIADQGRIPNEDALSLVFDDTLLFDIDKPSGYDRIETGTRANIGVRYTLQRHAGGYVQAVFGQSLHLGGDNDFPMDSGLETDRSDYVAGLYIQPFSNLSLVAQSRFDEDNFTIRRTDLTANASYGPLSGSVTYANLDAQPGLGIVGDREEILTSGRARLTKYWSLFGHIRYDVEREQRITDAIGLQYADDCFAISLSYHESFIRDRDIEPDQKVMVRLELKHLGAFDFDVEPSLLNDTGP